MISIIVASVDKHLLDQLKRNIKRTIGVPYEIIAFENSDGQNGLCKLYNEGANAANYEILCFSHEDVLFQTPNWGKKIVDIFRNTPDLGLLGVAGSTYKSIIPSSWSPPFDYNESTWRINILQGFKNKPLIEKHDFRNPKNELLSSVASIDGVWMCSTKKIILEHPFDEALLTGFHGYDVDISIKISQQYKVYVTHEVLLKHLSEVSALWSTSMKNVMMSLALLDEQRRKKS
uniref:glycosyltransferase n=1 Tax=Olivibacter sp. XZL3 TaxID=1735116 RepID=UPI00197DC0CD